MDIGGEFQCVQGQVRTVGRRRHMFDKLTRYSLKRLTHRLKQLQEKNVSDQNSPILTFDKDDVDTLDFVTAAANLRAATFQVELKSKFDVKREFIK